MIFGYGHLKNYLHIVVFQGRQSSLALKIDVREFFFLQTPFVIIHYLHDVRVFLYGCQPFCKAKSLLVLESNNLLSVNSLVRYCFSLKT